MREAGKNKLDDLCGVIGCKFDDRSLLSEALTHSSFRYELSGSVRGSNEVLEFLGDAVLNLAVASYLVEHFPDKNEGDLSKMRAELVNEPTLAQVAKHIGLDGKLLIGKSAKAGGGEIPRSILADGVEALIGAVFRDGGYRKAADLIIRLLEPFLRDNAFEKGTDYKTRLQEYTQKIYRVLPEYCLDDATGPDHERAFESSVWIEGRKMGSGKGRSIKISEQRAARQALEKLGKGSPEAENTDL